MSHILRNNELYIPGERKQLMVDLWNRDTKEFSMIYDLPLHSVRFESKKIRRVFMIYNEGKRQPKTLLKNEYGFDIGTIDPLKNTGNHSCIELFGDIFYYNNDCLAKNVLHLYKTVGAKPLLSTTLRSAFRKYCKRKKCIPVDRRFFSLLTFWFMLVRSNSCGAYRKYYWPYILPQ